MNNATGSASYSYNISHHHPYTPLLVDEASILRFVLKLGDKSTTTVLPSTTRESIVFVSLETKNSQEFLYRIINQFNPVFVFAHVPNLRSRIYYQGFSRLTGSSKLILWNSRDFDEVYIPCISCSTPAVRVNLEEVSYITGLVRNWNSVNQNNHGKILFTLGSQIQMWGCEDVASCTMLVLKQKYNLTVREAGYDMDESFLTLLIWGGVFNMDQELDKTHQIYWIKTQKFEFLVVARHTEISSGFFAFLSKSGGLTWFVTLVSGVAVVVMLTLQTVRGKVRVSQIIEEVATNWFV